MANRLFLKSITAKQGGAWHGALRYGHFPHPTQQGPMVNPRAPGFRAFQQFPHWQGHFGAGFGMQGDPGIFGAIGKALGKVAKGVAKAAFAATPVGAAYNAVRSAFNQPASRPPAPPMNWNPPISLPTLQPNPGTGLGPDYPPSEEEPVPASNTTVVSHPSGGMALVPTSGNVCTMKGYHLNRSGYWSNGSSLIPGAHWVAKGTMCVKNRRMNPFNPRAASRAMTRIASLHKGMKALDKQLQKMARRATPRHHQGGHGKRR